MGTCAFLLVRRAHAPRCQALRSPKWRGSRLEPRSCRQVFLLSPELGKGPAPRPARLALLGSLLVSRESRLNSRGEQLGPCHHFVAC